MEFEWFRRYTRLLDQSNCVYNLWACFSRELEIAGGNNELGDDDDLDEEQFLSRMRRLALQSTNNLVYQVQFFQLGQARGSPWSPT